jgi:transposase
MTMTHEERNERRKEIAEYAKEHSVTETAQHFGTTLATVYTSCRQYGESVKDMKADKRREIAEYASLHGSKEACVKYQVSQPHVARCLAENNMRAKVKSTASANTYRTIALLQRKMKQSEIAARLRVSRQRIGQIKEQCEANGVVLDVPLKEGE